MRERYVVAGLVALAMIGMAIVLERPSTSCPTDWGGAAVIDLGASFGDVMLDGTPYRVGGSALLDYMPRAVSSPLEGDRLRARGHPLGVTASISASSRDALGEPEFTCFRVTHGSEVWARRPTTYGIQTAADGYPPGAPTPARNEAWRMAVAVDGPEWPAGDQIGLELWASVRGKHYLFVVPPFPLMKGG